MADCVYFVFDGLADWEAGLAIAELNQSVAYTVRTMGFSKSPVTTMGGVRIEPELALQDMPPDPAMLILPGGRLWEWDIDTELLANILELHHKMVPIAAICGATLLLAKARLLDHIAHTSNGLPWLKSKVPTYEGESTYVPMLAVRDSNIITASGLGSVEFAREILSALAVFDEAELNSWYAAFKLGEVQAGRPSVMPPHPDA
jgi:putative intracellular protease/amidase